MTYGVTEQGFVIKPLTKIVSDIGGRMKASFGSQFDTSPESPDGQVIGIIADALHEHWLVQEASYNAGVPSKTFGAGLDGVVENNGIKRIQNTPTTVSCTMTVNDNFTVGAGSIVETGGLKFTVNENLTITSPATTGIVTVTCKTTGANVVPANATWTINAASADARWVGVTNPEAGVTGVVRETDSQLKARRNRNTINRGTNTFDAIYEAVAKLNLPYVHIIENDTAAAVGGQPANSFQVVVQGGTPVEIAKAIASNKPGGIRSYGDTTIVVKDRKGHPHNIGLTRPSDQGIIVQCDIVRLAGSSNSSAEKVRAAIAKYINNLNINQDVAWSYLFEPALTIPNIRVRSIKVALKGNTLGMLDLSIGPKLKPAVLVPATDIVINEV